MLRFIILIAMFAALSCLHNEMAAQDVAFEGASLAVSDVGEPATVEGECNACCDCCCAPYCWSGLYVGAFGSVNWADVDYSRGSAAPVGSPNNPFDADGFSGGALVGINRQCCDIVYGLEADFMTGEFEGSRPARSVLDFDIKSVSTLRGRIGRTRGCSLVYGTFGVALADVESQETGGVDTHDHVGLVVGAGVEWVYNNCWRLRGEYQYGVYETQRYRFTQTVPHFHRVNFDTHMARFGVIRAF